MKSTCFRVAVLLEIKCVAVAAHHANRKNGKKEQFHRFKLAISHNLDKSFELFQK